VGKWVGYGETGPDPPRFPRFARFARFARSARLAGFIVFLKELNAVSFFFDNLFDSLKGSKN